MDQEDVPGIQSLALSQASNYIPVSSTGLLIYDYLLTLSDEIRFVWPSQWKLGKVLYLLARYPALVDILLVPYRLSAEPPSGTTCRALMNITGWTYLVGLVIAEAIMVMRVWAMWNRSRVIGCSLTVLIAIFIAIGVVMSRTFAVKYELIDLAHRTSSPLPGCHFNTKSNTSYVSFLLLMVFEIVMLVLTMVKGIQTCAHPHSSFVHRFYQDGVVYYATLSIVSLLNVVMLMVGPPELATALVSPQHSFHAIFSSRILLRLREDASRRQGLATLTEPVGDLNFAHPRSGGAGTGTSNSSHWNGENARSWFGDAYSNVVGSDPREDEVS